MNERNDSNQSDNKNGAGYGDREKQGQQSQSQGQQSQQDQSSPGGTRTNDAGVVQGGGQTGAEPGGFGDETGAMSPAQAEQQDPRRAEQSARQSDQGLGNRGVRDDDEDDSAIGMNGE